jgi:hypothetical protein
MCLVKTNPTLVCAFAVTPPCSNDHYKYSPRTTHRCCFNFYLGNLYVRIRKSRRPYGLSLHVSTQSAQLCRRLTKLACRKQVIRHFASNRVRCRRLRQKKRAVKPRAQTPFSPPPHVGLFARFFVVRSNCGSNAGLRQIQQRQILVRLVITALSRLLLQSKLRSGQLFRVALAIRQSGRYSFL